MKFLRSHLLAACAASTLTALVVGSVAWAAIPNNLNGDITACYQKAGPAKGALRIIDHQAHQACRSGEATLVWPTHGFRWRGAWNARTAYQINDVVAYGGSTFIATKTTTNILPSSVGYWVLMTSKGSTGPAGPQGLEGAQGVEGPQGVAGGIGGTGPQGTPGAVGGTGAPGTPGTPGTPGLDGGTGPAGPPGGTGPAGTPGATGGTGASGTPGGTGGTGPVGGTGPQGIPGTTGGTGPIGGTGPQGVPGVASVGVVTGPVVNSDGVLSSFSTSATCTGGTTLISGGYEWAGTAPGNADITVNKPSGSSWDVTLTLTSNLTGVSVQAYAVCAVVGS
jgi:hypothetical protein